MPESTHDREHGVEVLRLLAVPRHLDVVLHELDALEDGRLAHDLAHDPEHLLVDQTREALQVGVGGLRVEVKQLVNVLCGFNALKQLEVAQSELCCNLGRVQLKLVDLTFLLETKQHLHKLITSFGRVSHLDKVRDDVIGHECFCGGVALDVVARLERHAIGNIGHLLGKALRLHKVLVLDAHFAERVVAV